MMKKLTTLIFFLAFPLISPGQQLWLSTSTGTPDNNVNTKVAIDNAGKFYTITTWLNASSMLYIQGQNANFSQYWSKYISCASPSGVFGTEIITNGASSLYIVGHFSAPIYFQGSVSLYPQGAQDAFIIKMSTSGAFTWIRQLSGGTIYADNIAIDSLENIYISGTFLGTADFDGGAGTHYVSCTGDSDLFIEKLDSAGKFAWVKTMMGVGQWGNWIADMAVANGNIYTTGEIGLVVDLDPGLGVQSFSALGFSDMFIQKLDTSGNLVWAKQIGGAGYCYGTAVAVAPNEDIFIAGSYSDDTLDLDPGSGTANIINYGSYDGFLVKLDSSCNFSWGKTIGGWGLDNCQGLVLDSVANVYALGAFEGMANLNDPNLYYVNSAGSSDIYFQKRDSSGAFIWGTSIGGDDSDMPGNIQISPGGLVFVAGNFMDSIDLAPGNATALHPRLGGYDAFIAAYTNPGPTGIPMAKNTFRQADVYPNPSPGAVFISSGDEIEEVTVTDMLGRQVYADQPKKKNFRLTIETPGTYVIRVTSGGHTTVKKIIIY